MPLACVLQHIRCEPPGLFSGPLRDRGFTVETVELDEGGRLPDWREVSLVLAMGGPMGAYDEAAHPWLAAEKRWIAAAVRAGTPFLGVCLGAQLLAASLGAEVRPGDAPEVGVLPVEVTAAGRADPVFGVLGARFPALQWHGDTFAIPAGGVHLGRSAAYPNSAAAVLGEDGFQQLAAAFAAARDPMARSASDLLHAWLDQASSTS